MTNTERQQTMLMFAGAFGGTILAIEGYRALSSGVWIEGPKDERPSTGGEAAGNFIALNAGLLLLMHGAKEAKAQYGTRNLALGTLAGAGIIALVKTIAGR